MTPWETIEPAKDAAEDGALSLHRRGDEWSIRSAGVELMNSRRFGSERALAKHVEEDVGDGARRVLIGGLGLGHTLAAALESFDGAEIVVAEISPRIIAWNRDHVGHLAGHPLDDSRCEVFPGDVRSAIDRAAEGDSEARFDAILLDVDNGPEALSQDSNAALYGSAGIRRTAAALRDKARIGYWSAGPSKRFERQLHSAGLDFRLHRAPVRDGGRGRAKHVLWIASLRDEAHD